MQGGAKTNLFLSLQKVSTSLPCSLWPMDVACCEPWPHWPAVQASQWLSCILCLQTVLNHWQDSARCTGAHWWTVQRSQSNAWTHCRSRCVPRIEVAAPLCSQSLRVAVFEGCTPPGLHLTALLPLQANRYACCCTYMSAVASISMFFTSIRLSSHRCLTHVTRGTVSFTPRWRC